MLSSPGRWRPLIILALGISLTCFPARPLFSLGPSKSSFDRCLHQLPVKPQRLRIFHPGVGLQLALRQVRRLDKPRSCTVVAIRRTPGDPWSIVTPGPLAAPAVSPSHPLLC
jgi:hypothetical protein